MNHSTALQIREPSLVKATIQSTDPVQMLPVVPTMSFSFRGPGWNPGRCTAFSCHVSPIFNLEVSPSSLPFVSLADLKSSGLLFCRMTFNLGSSDVFSWAASGRLLILDRNTTDRILCLHPVVLLLSATLPHSHHLHLVINTDVVRRYYEITPISWRSSNLCPPALTSVDNSWLTRYHSGCQRGMFPFSAVLLPFVGWHSTTRKTFLSSPCVYLWMGSWIPILFNWLTCIKIIIYFSIQIIPSWADRPPSGRLLVSFALSLLCFQHFLNVWGNKAFQAHLYAPCSSLGISHFYKESWFLLVEGGI